MADVDSVFGLTAPLGAPPEVRPFSLVVCELTVSEVAPRFRKWLMTDAGMVMWDPSVVWKVPPASMLDGGAVDAETTAGKLVVPKPGTVHESVAATWASMS